MAVIFRRISDFFFLRKKRTARKLLFFLLFYFKFLWFDFSWCMISTFRPFSYFETYLFPALAALVLMLPLFLRMVKTTFALAVLTGILLLSNLLYFRTYYTAIPLSSYGLIGNLSGYESSIFSSLRWTDMLFPLSTVAALFICWKIKNRRDHTENTQIPVFRHFLLIFITACLSIIPVLAQGGFKKAYESLEDSYTHTCGPAIYTVFGSVYYDYIRDKEIYTPEVKEHIGKWMKERENRQTASPDQPFVQNCIIILAESFETWVLEKTVENQEITPCLNALLKDPGTLYAPNVLSQVKGGRSIDGQLMVNTGLLPINTGVYSLKYPQSVYPSLEKAMKEQSGGKSRSFILTADRPMTWNQNVIAASFGFDTLVSKADFVHDEKVGPHYRRQLGDASLLRQCAAKIKSGETWINGANIVQIVTYSGHFPFALPGHLRQLTFSDAIPPMLRDYMTVANYTDRAIGDFIDFLRTEPLFKNTLVVITGDHEGLMKMRDELYSTKKGRELISPEPFVPFIVANLPEDLCSRFTGSGMRYGHVMGQIDIYPTLLDLLGLSGYSWKGLGVSILNANKPLVAIDPHGQIYGDTTGVTPAQIFHLKDAWQVSDEIIRYNYFGKDR